MNSKSLTLIMAVIACIVLIAVIFAGVMVENILNPAAHEVWILLRNSLLLIDQIIIWWVVVAAGIVILLIQLFVLAQKKGEDIEQIEVTNLYLVQVSNWKSNIPPNAHQKIHQNRLKPVLIKFLVSLYAARKRLPYNYILTEAFKNKRINLPEEIYNFLFSAEQAQTPKDILRNLLREISGPNARKYRADLISCIKYIESDLENSNE